MTRRFSFIDVWRTAASPERVRDVLVDLEHYPEWWREVRAVASLGPDDSRVLIRSVLPYTLDVSLHAISRELPTLHVEIDGDLRGWVRWTLAPDGAGTVMRFEQEVELATLPGIVVGVGRPVLRWNHVRMMASCRTGLADRLSQDAQHEQ